MYRSWRKQTDTFALIDFPALCRVSLVFVLLFREIPNDFPRFNNYIPLIIINGETFENTKKLTKTQFSIKSNALDSPSLVKSLETSTNNSNLKEDDEPLAK